MVDLARHLRLELERTKAAYGAGLPADLKAEYIAADDQAGRLVSVLAQVVLA